MAHAGSPCMMNFKFLGLLLSTTVLASNTVPPPQEQIIKRPLLAQHLENDDIIKAIFAFDPRSQATMATFIPYVNKFHSVHNQFQLIMADAYGMPGLAQVPYHVNLELFEGFRFEGDKVAALKHLCMVIHTFPKSFPPACFYPLISVVADEFFALTQETLEDLYSQDSKPAIFTFLSLLHGKRYEEALNLVQQLPANFFGSLGSDMLIRDDFMDLYDETLRVSPQLLMHAFDLSTALHFFVYSKCTEMELTMVLDQISGVLLEYEEKFAEKIMLLLSQTGIEKRIRFLVKYMKRFNAQFWRQMEIYNELRCLDSDITFDSIRPDLIAGNSEFRAIAANIAHTYGRYEFVMKMLEFVPFDFAWIRYRNCRDFIRFLLNNHPGLLDAQYFEADSDITDMLDSQPDFLMHREGVQSLQELADHVTLDQFRNIFAYLLEQGTLDELRTWYGSPRMSADLRLALLAHPFYKPRADLLTFVKQVLSEMMAEGGLPDDYVIISPHFTLLKLLEDTEVASIIRALKGSPLRVQFSVSDLVALCSRRTSFERLLRVKETLNAIEIIKCNYKSEPLSPVVLQRVSQLRDDILPMLVSERLSSVLCHHDDLEEIITRLMPMAEELFKIHPRDNSLLRDADRIESILESTQRMKVKEQYLRMMEDNRLTPISQLIALQVLQFPQ